MAYPGKGLKKPLNMIENPIYPDIKKGPPTFKWSRKFWQVDVGATTRDTEPFTQFYEPAVLAQSRDYNRTVYGQSSHKDIVNAEFRPPLLSYYEDIGPVNRIPATIQAIIPHINPGTAGHGSGSSGYTAKNERISNIEKALTDRVASGQWRPTFFAPIEVPADNSVLPDLEAKLPPISLHAGWRLPVFNAPLPEDKTNLGDEKFSVPIQSGYKTQVRIDGGSGLENYQTILNMPNISVTAGVNTPVQIGGGINPQNYDFDDVLPQTSVTAGFDTQVQIGGGINPQNYDFGDNRPQVSVSAGVNTPLQIDAETKVADLLDNRPQVSATAGMNTPLQLDAEMRMEDFETKLGGVNIGVLNPGSETGYKERLSMYAQPEDFIQDKRPSYSYEVNRDEPVYRERNEQSRRPHFHQRLQPIKSYGQIAQSGGHIPQFGLDMPQLNFGGKTNERMNPAKRKAVYSF